MNGKYKVPDLSGIGQEPAEETLAGLKAALPEL